MAKILYLITQSELGGAQKNALDLARALKGKHEILVAAGEDGGGSFFGKLEQAGIPFKKLHWLHRRLNPFLDFLAFWEIKELLKKEKPAILHLHSSKAGFLGSLAVDPQKTKIIYTVHGAVFEAPFKILSKKLFLWLEKLTAPKKRKIICVSQNDKNLWLKNKAALEEKLVVVRNGLNLENIVFLEKEKARQDLTLPQDAKIIGCIANFYPEKGLSYLIEAANILKQKNIDPIFALIGDGKERKDLEEKIKKYHLENFLLLGRKSNAVQYLKAFDLLVLPSVKEGLPYVILEAMAAGLPIVASRIGGIPEMIEEGQNGFLTEPRDAQALAQKIAEILENPAIAQKFGQVSKEKLPQFSLSKMIDETERIYLD